MATQNLSKIFQPRSIAIVGATSREHSVGRTLLENHQRAGFEGEVYAVNPQHESLLGVACYPSVRELPKVVDLAIIATPAVAVAEIVRGCGESGIPGVIVVSAGFREVGGAGKALEDQLAAEIAKFPAMRVIGPNCLGVLVPASRLNASFATAMPENGRIAFVSQSGALCTSILDWSLSERIGFSHFVSIGNSLDVKFGDLIDYFAEDESTDSIVLYIESITEARRFMSAARAFTRTKPIVVYKAGRFAQSAQAAASHTGAMAGVDAVYEAAFQRAGIVRVYDAEEMFDCAELLARHQPPEGPRLAIVTNAGGPGVMATDALLQCGGELAELSPQTLAALDEVLPPHWSHNNPVDVLGDALPERYRRAVELVLNDNHVDAVLATLSPQTMTEPTQTAELLAGVAAKTRKPVLAVWMGGQSVAAGRELMNRAGVATFDSPDRAVRAFTYLYSYKRNREILYETPRQVPLDKWLDERAAHERLTGYLAEGRTTLTETESKALLADYGVLSTTPLPARTSLEAIKIARQIGYPVVMKVHSPQILHKTEVHGVVTGVSSDERTSRVFREIVARARQMRPTAEVEGVTIQPMISSAEGIELIVGAKRDPVFGAVIMVGAGGVTAEVLHDRALELPPLNERLARRMLESLKIRPLLEGFRGRGPVHLSRLIETLMRISYLIADNPEILELDVNPLLVTPDGVTALDARVILDPKARLQKPRPYSHLAIRPYPDEYVSYKTLRDGANILLRPVRPEDEPLWIDFLTRCSERSLWLRFRYLFKESSHELATRFCFIDYDRTMAIVAEVDDGSERQLVGVGRLVADADHREAEYAVLVSDEWQGRGVGSLLTDYCLEICQTWGISRVVAETTVENDRMKHLLLNREFDRRHCGDSREVLYEKQFRLVPAPAGGTELVRAGSVSTGVGLGE